MVDQDNATLGVVLAGGLSRRMEGTEKSLMALDGETLVARVARRLGTQTGITIINANGSPDRFASLGLPVQADVVEGFAGPLAGILSAMQWAREHSTHTRRIVTAAADTPFFPQDLNKRFMQVLAPLKEAEKDRTICMAASNGNRHPVFGSWPVALYEPLRAFLVEESERKVILFARRYNLQMVEFPVKQTAAEALDPFFNINTPGDFITAKSLAEVLVE